MDNNITVEGTLGKIDASTDSSIQENHSSTEESIVFKTTSATYPKTNDTVSNTFILFGFLLLLLAALLLAKKHMNNLISDN